MQGADNVIPFPGLMGGGFGFDPYAFLQSRPRLLRRGRSRRRFVVRLDLDGAKPPIWRRLHVASDLRLSQLHDIIQVAMGWTDSHLHHFQMGPDAKDFRMQPFLTPFDLEEGETDGILESEVRLDQVLAKPGQRLFYEYDFGDCWHHTVKLEKVEPWVDGDPTARCVAGRRACPPEDVGGIGGYEEVLAALDGHVAPGNEEWMAQVLDWLPLGFDPAALVIEAINRALDLGPFPDLDRWQPFVVGLLARDRSAGRMGLELLLREALVDEGEPEPGQVEALTRRYRVLLATVGEGASLTAAGYLPPALVAELCTELGETDMPWGAGAREDRTPTIRALRESATALGLVRKANGRLHPTRAGRALADDPGGLLGHIRSRVPFGRTFDRDAGLMALLFAAAGRDWRASRQQAADIAASLGWDSDDLAGAVHFHSRSMRDVLDQIGGPALSATPQTRATAARALLRKP